MIKFRLEERAKSPYWLIILSPFIAILVAIILAGILIILAGANPFESYYQLIIGAFGSKNSFAETLARATPKAWQRAVSPASRPLLTRRPRSRPGLRSCAA